MADLMQRKVPTRPWLISALATLAILGGLACARPVPGPPKGSVHFGAFSGPVRLAWCTELGYQADELHPLTLSPATHTPFVEVLINGVRTPLMLDTGTARGFMITPVAPAIPYQTEGSGQELNPDGSPRGDAKAIRVASMEVCGRRFENVAGTLSAWQTFSSAPFEGTLGLAFFLDRRLTIDYVSRTVAVSASPLPERLDRNRYLVLDLIDPPGHQGHILYVRARVHGRPALVYLDTGLNPSFIDPSFGAGLPRQDLPGSRFPVLRRGIPLELDGHTFALNNLREDPIRRGFEDASPVALSLGSDILSGFILTIDLRTKKLVLARAQ